MRAKNHSLHINKAFNKLEDDPLSHVIYFQDRFPATFASLQLVYGKVYQVT